MAISKDNHQAWSQQDLRNLAGENFIRVMKDVEKYRLDNMNTKVDQILPYEDLIPTEDLTAEDSHCRSPPPPPPATP